MNLFRVFIAIEIPPEIRRAIAFHTTDLRKKLGKSLVRWVPLSNIHLTLKFLGDVSKPNVELLAQMLSAEATSHMKFSFQVGTFGVFPQMRKPRVLWIGIQAPVQLETLYQGVEAAAERLGYERESRKFSPHLTIGRVNQRIEREDIQRLRATLSQVDIPLLGTVEVNAIHLFRSELTPSGAIYTRLHSAPLGT
jgi:2'-5' RNA ligase